MPFVYTSFWVSLFVVLSTKQRRTIFPECRYAPFGVVHACENMHKGGKGIASPIIYMLLVLVFSSILCCVAFHHDGSAMAAPALTSYWPPRRPKCAAAAPRTLVVQSSTSGCSFFWRGDSWSPGASSSKDSSWCRHLDGYPCIKIPNIHGACFSFLMFTPSVRRKSICRLICCVWSGIKTFGCPWNIPLDTL